MVERIVSLRRAAALACGWLIVAVIAWLSLTPSPPTLDFQWGDKLGHLAAYGGLMFWFSRLYTSQRSRLAFALAWVAMGIGLEFTQGALGYRAYEMLDMVANTLGVLAGWAIARQADCWLLPGGSREASKLR